MVMEPPPPGMPEAEKEPIEQARANRAAALCAAPGLCVPCAVLTASAC